ncbi:glycosyltransferase [Globicatella sulfidifaciens]|uniref:Glycosyltransferase family 4 protein n=1 Tax=Globicatella sulfidifaciens TaxID=136093 RepID=A0A7X8C542_9LACT|nr:glycosyltransferase [Globicatella sulfidifaciens]NLJ19141.1 glycosyltransferase family 4 protein [Globicatella sulfidifaciens]
MAKQKKVVHLTTVHHPFDTRIYHKECLSLHKAGYNVSLIVALANKKNGEEVVTKDGIRLIATKKRKSRLARMILSTWKTYRLAKKENADYYHFHDPELLWVGWLLKNKNNHVIYDVHEDYYTGILQKDYLKRPIKKIVAKLYDIIEKFFIKCMDIALAEKYYQERYPQGKQILNYPILDQTLLQVKRNTEKPSNTLIYTGNVTEVRGSYLHAKLPKLPSKPEVYFYGKCDRSIAERMNAMAGSASDRLHFTGIDRFVEREDIDQAYLEKNWLAGLAIFPPTEHYKRKELTKFFEYMTAGIPIICSNFPVWQKFIDRYRCGLTVDPNNPEEWEQAINYLKNYPDERQEMIANGRRAIKNELNWQAEEEKLLTWYYRLDNND